MDINLIYKHLNITNENTCFDYIESIDYNVKRKKYIIGLFIEPVGNGGFETKLKNEKDIAKELSRIFNAQPLNVDYIRGGWITYINSKHLLNKSILLENIDEEEFWSDKFLELEESISKNTLTNHILTIEDMYRLKFENNKPLYFRLGDTFLDIDDDVSIAELIYMKPLDNYSYLCLFDKRPFINLMKELNILNENYLTNNPIVECILNGDESLLDLYIKEYNNTNKDDIIKEIKNYKEYKDDLCYDEYLDKLNKENQDVFNSYYDSIIETINTLYENVDVNKLKSDLNNTKFKDIFMLHPEYFEFVEPQKIINLYLSKDYLNIYNKK